jgi:nucleotide-binding universal stress UspA family protein
VPIDGAELLLIRPWDTPAALRPATVLGRRVLVALDGSDLAGAALPVARLLAERAGGEVVLMRVVPPRHDAAAYAGRARAATPVEERRRAEAYLEDMAGGLRERGVRASTTVRVAEDVAQAIADAASTDGADVIAMSTHGRGALGRLFCGSVADRVSHVSRVPVLLVHPARRAAPPPGEPPGAVGASGNGREGDGETAGNRPVAGGGPQLGC